MPERQDLKSHLDAGLEAHRRGDLETAKNAYLRVLSANPEQPDALHLLGVALLQLGQMPQALELLERAASLQRNNAAVIGNLAQAYFENSRFAESHESFRKASRLDPRNVQFQLGAANSLAMQGKLGNAEVALRKLADRFPQDARIQFNLGNVLRDRGRPDDAINTYRTAMRLDPQLLDAHNNLADVLHKSLRFEEAEREYRACLAAAPDYLLARCNLASVLMDLGRFEESEALCREIIARVPRTAQAHTLLGAALGHQGRLIEAVASHSTAAELAPQDGKVAQNLASALTDSGQLPEAMRWFQRARALNPQLRSTRQLFSYALLGQGRFAEGWDEYGYRVDPDFFRQQFPHIPLARTLAADLGGKHVCVVREQGIGDEIFFLRFAPQLHAAGARITYCATDKIRSLLERVPTISQVLGQETPPPAGADAVILAGDLPHAMSDFPMSTLPSTLPAAPAQGVRDFPEIIAVYWPKPAPPLALTPLPARTAEMLKRLASLGDPPYIGLTWRGGTPPREQRMVIWALYKEIGIAQFGAALRRCKGTFLALQRKPAAGEIGAMSNALGKQLHDFTALNEDLEGMLALLALIDDYIGVSNTNMHLRAGVGKAGRVLVPCQPDWRWMFSGKSCVWFPGFSVYRQTARGDWGPALNALARDLAARW